MKYLKKYNIFNTNESNNIENSGYSIEEFINDLETDKIKIDLKLPNSFIHKKKKEDYYKKNILKYFKRKLEYYKDKISKETDISSKKRLQVLLYIDNEEPIHQGYEDPISGEFYDIYLFNKSSLCPAKTDYDSNLNLKLEEHIGHKEDVITEYISTEIHIKSGAIAIGGDNAYYAIVKNHKEEFDNKFGYNFNERTYVGAKKHIDYYSDKNIFFVNRGFYGSYYRKNNSIIIAEEKYENDEIVLNPDLGKFIKKRSIDIDPDHSTIICDALIAKNSSHSKYNFKENVDLIKVPNGTYRVKYRLDRSTDYQIEYIIEPV